MENVSSLGKFKSSELDANGSKWKFVIERVGDDVSMFLQALNDTTKFDQYELSVSFTVNSSSLSPIREEFSGDLRKGVSKIGSSKFMSWKEFEKCFVNDEVFIDVAVSLE